MIDATWQPGDPIYHLGNDIADGASVEQARAIADVIDDTLGCRMGACVMCNHGIADNEAMVVKFGGQP